MATVNVNAKKKTWTKEEDQELKRVLETFNAKTDAKGTTTLNGSWGQVSDQMPGRSAKQCRERWCYNLSPAIRRDLWTVEEDAILIEAQQCLGNQWALIARRLAGRTENSVKIRFKSIRRAARRAWTERDDKILMQLHQNAGSDWAIIASKMPNRTRNGVKTRCLALKRGHVDPLPQKGAPEQIIKDPKYEQLVEILLESQNHYGTSLDAAVTPAAAERISSSGSCNSSVTSESSISSSEDFIQQQLANKNKRKRPVNVLFSSPSETVSSLVAKKRQCIPTVKIEPSLKLGTTSANTAPTLSLKPIKFPGFSIPAVQSPNSAASSAQSSPRRRDQVTQSLSTSLEALQKSGLFPACFTLPTRKRNLSTTSNSSTLSTASSSSATTSSPLVYPIDKSLLKNHPQHQQQHLLQSAALPKFSLPLSTTIAPATLAPANIGTGSSLNLNLNVNANTQLNTNTNTNASVALHDLLRSLQQNSNSSAKTNLPVHLQLLA